MINFSATSSSHSMFEFMNFARCNVFLHGRLVVTHQAPCSRIKQRGQVAIASHQRLSGPASLLATHGPLCCVLPMTSSEEDCQSCYDQLAPCPDSSNRYCMVWLLTWLVLLFFIYLFICWFVDCFHRRRRTTYHTPVSMRCTLSDQLTWHTCTEHLFSLTAAAALSGKGK